MHWIHLTDEVQLQDVIIKSQERPQVIFKYSSVCGLSKIIYKRLESKCCPSGADFYFLDLQTYSEISDRLDEKFQTPNESTQVLIIKDGECSVEVNDVAINELITEN